MKKVLIISRNAWSNSISTGNTLSNFFRDWETEKIANIYCRNEKINNSICKKYYRITEIDLINCLKHGGIPGKEIEIENDIETKDNETSKKVYSNLRKHKFVILLWARELLWKSGKWKNDNLNGFLDSFNPDIIYMPIYDCFYMHDLLQYCANRTNAKVVLFTGDDMYSLRQFSLSPLYWINRLILRKKIRQSIEISSKRYCLMESQAIEYEGYFNRPFDILIKEMSSDNHPPKRQHESNTIRIVYTGNIDRGRFDSLYMFSKELDNFTNYVLDIYSGSKLTKNQIKKLEKHKGVKFKGEISPEEVKAAQIEADIAVHVEGFGIEERLRNRLSFSTKIVDYLSNGKCIFAIGWKESSSIQYLLNNGIACVATNKKDMLKSLEMLSSFDYRYHLASKAYEFAKNNHENGINGKKLIHDFNEICCN